MLARGWICSRQDCQHCVTATTAAPQRFGQCCCCCCFCCCIAVVTAAVVVTVVYVVLFCSPLQRLWVCAGDPQQAADHVPVPLRADLATEGWPLRTLCPLLPFEPRELPPSPLCIRNFTCLPSLPPLSLSFYPSPLLPLTTSYYPLPPPSPLFSSSTPYYPHPLFRPTQFNDIVATGLQDIRLLHALHRRHDQYPMAALRPGLRL